MIRRHHYHHQHQQNVKARANQLNRPGGGKFGTLKKLPTPGREEKVSSAVLHVYIRLIRTSYYYYVTSKSGKIVHSSDIRKCVRHIRVPPTATRTMTTTQNYITYYLLPCTVSTLFREE